MSPYRRGGDLRPSASRPPRQRRGNRIFYTVAEGEGTEYDYLSHLNRTYGADCGFLIRWPSQRRGFSPAQVINEARSAIGEPGVEVWGLFDHDGRTDIAAPSFKRWHHHALWPYDYAHHRVLSRTRPYMLCVQSCA